MKINRYPGVKPFQRDEQALFFGRAREIRELCDLVRVEKIVVLFGKSGYGKSSLLNAGVLPQLAANMQAIEVRFGEYIPGQSPTPLDAVRRRLDDKVGPDAGMDFLDALEGPDSLWRAFKKRGARPMLLVFDQFEEFFSYPPEQQQAFKRELAELLDADLPDTLRESARGLSRDQRRLLAAPPNVHALFAIRSDRMSELDRLKDQLPAILHKRYELKALTTSQAREAIVGPASLLDKDLHQKDIKFSCPAFDYREDTLQYILADLSRSNTNVQQQSGIEAFQLQVLCDTIEELVRSESVLGRDDRGCPEVRIEDLPDFDQVYGEYYERRLQLLPEDQRSVARRVIEDGLVRIDPMTSEGRRMSVDGDALLQTFKHVGLTSDLLRQLENTFLVRREPNNIGGYNYEICHDTLLGPITRAARLRREDEENQQLRREAEEAQRREAEALAREKHANRRRRRATILAWGAGFAAVLAVISTFFAISKTEESNQRRRQADMLADSVKSINTELLEANRVAEDNWKHAKAAEDSLLIAYQQIKLEKNATEKQRAIAFQRYRDAEEQRKEAERIKIKLNSTLDEIAKDCVHRAQVEINKLNYKQAFYELKIAKETGQRGKEVAGLLLEISYFYNEAGIYYDAYLALSYASTLLDGRLKSEINKTYKEQKDTLYAMRLFRKYQEELHEDLFAVFKARYFPQFESIIVDDSNVQEDSIPDQPYRLALTEITVWQYYLFMTAKSKANSDSVSLFDDYSVHAFEGKQAVKNVNYYDAILYANWLSAKEGLDPVYTIDTIYDEYYQKNYYDVSYNGNKGGYRLPTEIEWNYAAVSEINDSNADLNAMIWHKHNSSQSNHNKPARSNKPNPEGIYNMLGNMWEWCEWSDARNDERSETRPLRGGSWKDSCPKLPDIKKRKLPVRAESVDNRDITFGFRLCRSH